MTACDWCDGHGLVVVPYTDAEPDFALCLCEAGQSWRRAENHGTPTNPLWHVWCATHQVAHERIVALEDVMTPAEFAASGFAPASVVDREARLRAVGKGKR